jgi:putative DeoR family transcriptional regulator (stage III sporulation protein D)
MQENFLKGYIEERAVKMAQYIVDNNATVRQTAKAFGISKSTVHKDITVNLKKINPELHIQVKRILEVNKQERHLRGGEATKQKFLHAKERINNC